MIAEYVPYLQDEMTSEEDPDHHMTASDLPHVLDHHYLLEDQDHPQQAQEEPGVDGLAVELQNAKIVYQLAQVQQVGDVDRLLPRLAIPIDLVELLEGTYFYFALIFLIWMFHES